MMWAEPGTMPVRKPSTVPRPIGAADARHSSRLGESSPSAEVKEASTRVAESLFGDSPFVIASAQKGSGVEGSTGVAVYFPLVGDVHVAYDGLDFGADTQWGQLITKYGEA